MQVVEYRPVMLLPELSAASNEPTGSSRRQKTEGLLLSTVEA